jgi:hypothetical protein
MVADQYDDAQQFHFLRNEALPFNLKTKVKICPDLKSAWLKLEDEFGQADQIALFVLKVLAGLQLKAGTEHENFVILYDNWKKTEADLAEIGKLACLQEQRSIDDVVTKMPKVIRDRYILESAPKLKANGSTPPSHTEWQCLSTFMETQNMVSKAVARMEMAQTSTAASAGRRGTTGLRSAPTELPKHLL